MIRSSLFVPFLLILLSGCHHGQTGAEHLEHVTPAHKPRDLATALDQIEVRLAELNRLPPRDSSEREERLRELIDIVRWLPEIAGDSDLPEREWNTVDQFSQSFAPRLQSLQTHADRALDSDLIDSAARSIDQLRQFLPPNPKPSPSQDAT